MTNRFRVFLFILVMALVLAPYISCGGSGAGKDKVAVDDANSKYPPAPDAVRNAEIELIDGTKFKLADKKGKVVLVNLWATWCGPCRFEMPELVKMQEEYKDKGFEVIGLDVDPEPVEEIQPFAKKMGLTYQLGWAERELVIEFFNISGTEGIPQSFLLNRNGELTGVFFGVNESVIKKMKETVAKVVEDRGD
jgi:thiol-disulfide isomerase/thioredoxin